MKRGHRTGGFTLVEVLVAMAIFALLVGVLYGSLSSVTRAYDAAERSVDDGARVRIGSEFLSRLIETAYPLALAEGRSWEAQFSGDANAFRFIADMPGYVGVSGVHEVVLSVREEEGESALWFAWRPVHLDALGKKLTGEFQQRVLVPGVAALKVRYFGAETEEQLPGWNESWSRLPSMPELVEVILEDADGVRWPELIVRPRANTLRYLSARKGAAASGSPSAGGDQTPESRDPVLQPQPQIGSGAVQ